MIEPCPGGCQEMQYRGITGLGAYPFERWQCPVCGREEARACDGSGNGVRE